MKNIFILKTLILVLGILTLAGCKISDPNQIALKLTNRFTKEFDSYEMMLRTISNYKVCLYSQEVTLGQKDYIAEARRRGLDCGFAKKNNTNNSNSNSILKTDKKYKSSITKAELNAAKKEANKLKQELKILKKKELQQKQKIKIDYEKPIIRVFVKRNGPNSIISGRVTDNVKVAEVLVDGQAQELKSMVHLKLPFTYLELVKLSR